MTGSASLWADLRKSKEESIKDLMSASQLDMPAPDVQAASGGDDFWAMFSQLSDRNPAAAWQLLSQATPEALRSKVLVSEG